MLKKDEKTRLKELSQELKTMTIINSTKELENLLDKNHNINIPKDLEITGNIDFSNVNVLLVKGDLKIKDSNIENAVLIGETKSSISGDEYCLVIGGKNMSSFPMFVTDVSFLF